MEYQPGEIYVRQEEWELVGRMEDVNDAADVAKFLRRRDSGEYQYAYVDRSGTLVEP